MNLNLNRGNTAALRTSLYADLKQATSTHWLHWHYQML